MKNNILSLFLFLLFIPAFSQNSGYEYNGRRNPSVKKEKLKEVQLISDLTPELWNKMGLPYKERIELERRRSMGYPLGYYLYPLGGYDVVIDYVSVEISATINGNVLTAQSTSDRLTKEQKNILNAAALGSDVRVKIMFNYKKQVNGFDNDDKTIEGNLMVTVVPETEAEYPGGFKEMTAYFKENVINKISGQIREPGVKFTVNEEGQVIDAYISSTSMDLKIDKLVLDAINKMPKWKPAKNSKGIKVKQEFNLEFGDGC